MDPYTPLPPAQQPPLPANPQQDLRHTSPPLQPLLMAQPTPYEPRRNQWVPDRSDLPEPVSLPEPHAHTYNLHPQQLYVGSDGDKDEDNAGDNAGTAANSEAGPSGRDRPKSRWQKKRFMVPLAVFITLVAVGAVMAGVLGTILRTSGPDHDPSSATNDTDHEDQHNGFVHPASNLAAAIAGASTAKTRVLLFQDPDGDLVAIEWQGSSGRPRPMASLFGEGKPPKPLSGSPFHLVEFGPGGQLHFFYIDDALRLAHIVRRPGSGQNGRWHIGSLSTSEGRFKLYSQPSDTLRLSVAVLPAELTSTSDGVVVVMYQIDPGPDYVTLVSSPEPDDTKSWRSQPFSLGASASGRELNPKSPGLLILPGIRKATKSSKSMPTIQIIWDLANDSNKTTLAALECVFTDSERVLEDCLPAPDDSRDSNAEERLLDTRKPLILSALTVHYGDDETADSPDYLVRALDRDGLLIELLIKNSEWAGHQAFLVDTNSLPKGVSANFTSVASAGDGILYAVSEGQLLEFARQGAWWEDRSSDPDTLGWKFLSVIDTTIPRG